MFESSDRVQSIVFALFVGVVFMGCGEEMQEGPRGGEYYVSERIQLDITTQPVSQGPRDAKTFVDSLSDATVPALNETMATALASLPLACVDRLHSRSSSEGYLYRETEKLRPTYEDSLAFYGCSDWHSAVNSTWTLIRLHKEFPNLYIGEFIRQKLENHLSEGSMAGELHFFKEVASEGFERPYGWAWLMNVYTELETWDREEAQKWADNVKPLTDLFAERMIEYLNNLSYPMREGQHDNTAFSFNFMLQYAELTGNDKLTEAIVRRAKDFYLDDVGCPISYEPSGSSFLSPCLAQAEVMSRILTPDSFATWLDTFLAPVGSPRFAVLTQPIEGGEGFLEDLIESSGEEEEASDDDEDTLQGAKSHLIGLSFHRADALRAIANALPPDEARTDAYRKVANLNAKRGFEAMFNAGYVGTHWLGTYAVLALVD